MGKLEGVAEGGRLALMQRGQQGDAVVLMEYITV